MSGPMSPSDDHPEPAYRPDGLTVSMIVAWVMLAAMAIAYVAS